MATDKQVGYVESLMREHGLTRDDLAKQDPAWFRFEQLSTRKIQPLIAWIRGDDGDALGEISDRHAWRVLAGLLNERRFLHEANAATVVSLHRIALALVLEMLERGRPEELIAGLAAEWRSLGYTIEATAIEVGLRDAKARAPQ